MGCIYGFFDRCGNVFYVGQTSLKLNERLSNHKRELEKGNKLYCYNKLRKEIKETARPIKDFVQIIEDNVPTDKLDDKEIEFIALFRQRGYKLTNLTEGGRGSRGFSKTFHQKLGKIRSKTPRTEEWNRKIGESRKGIKHSIETKKKLSEARKNRIITEETRLKTSKTSKGKINIKTFMVTSPNGEVFVTTNGLNKFCEDHNLTPSLMNKTASGERKHHKGWKAERI